MNKIQKIALIVFVSSFFFWLFSPIVSGFTYCAYMQEVEFYGEYYTKCVNKPITIAQIVQTDAKNNNFLFPRWFETWQSLLSFTFVIGSSLTFFLFKDD